MKFSLLLLATAVAGCADPYLAMVKCIDNSATRAEADACRAKLHDAAAPAQKGDGGTHG